MKKKIKWIVGSVLIAIVVSVFVAQAMISDNIKSDIKTALHGILSPGQIGTLMDFKKDCTDKYTFTAHHRSAPFELWRSLDLTEDQQEQLLAMVDEDVDSILPYMMQVLETGVQLKKTVLSGGADASGIDGLADRLGEQIGEAAWNLAQLRAEAMAVLTREQQDLISQHGSEHRRAAQTFLDQLPDFSNDLFALWNDLQLAPNQMDALTAVHNLARCCKRGGTLKSHENLKTEVETVLSPAQSSVLEDFHAAGISEFGPGFHEILSERESLFKELDLSGEQKIELANLLLDKRKEVGEALQDVADAVFILHDAIHDDAPDSGMIKEAAEDLGNAVGRAAHTAAVVVGDARGILTPEQSDLLDSHMEMYFEEHLAQVRNLPGRIHAVFDLLQTLDLTPEQKEQIMNILVDHHELGHSGHRRLHGFL